MGLFNFLKSKKERQIESILEYAYDLEKLNKIGQRKFYLLVDELQEKPDLNRVLDDTTVFANMHKNGSLRKIFKHDQNGKVLKAIHSMVFKDEISMDNTKISILINNYYQLTRRDLYKLITDPKIPDNKYPSLSIKEIVSGSKSELLGTIDDSALKLKPIIKVV